MSSDLSTILKRLGLVFLVVVILTAIALLFSYDVIKIQWVSFMGLSPAMQQMEHPLPVAAQSIPIEGPAAIPNMGAPKNPVPADQTSLARGAELFQINCSVCHGLGGKGDGTVSTYLENKPADLTSPAVQFLSDGAIFMTITNGVAGKMPALNENLTVRERWDVVNFVRTLSNSSSATAAPTSAPSTSASPTETAAATASSSSSSSSETETTAARPSNPGGPGDAINLTGNVSSGQQIFVANCQTCHGTNGTGNVANPGSNDGTVPPLNPIDPTIANADPKTFATNVDLFVEHGSTPEGTNPTFSMPAWGDKKALTPQQIADVIAYVMSLNPVTNSSATAAPTPQGGVDVARPSNPGGPGQAVSLTGDPNSGKQIFVANCQTCHGTNGTGNVANPGSNDGTVPPLNPIDPTIANADPKVFAYNVDLFVEHGSTPAGSSPTFSMPAWGDKKALTPQQIADVIAYVMSLNPVSPASAGTAAPVATNAPTTQVATATASASSQTEPEPTEEVARPSNPGGPGDAINLTGNATAGAQVFASNCVPCHAAEGKGGNANPGSSDGTIPALNPIDPTIKNADPKTFAYNIDLFVQHGSTPEGANPTFSMPAWGDKNALTQQQIADVIAYIISLNP